MPQLMFVNIDPDPGIDSHFIVLGADETEQGYLGFVGHLEPGLSPQLRELPELLQARVNIHRIITQGRVDQTKVSRLHELKHSGLVEISEVRKLIGANRDDDVAITLMPDHPTDKGRILDNTADLTKTIVAMADLLEAWGIAQLTLQYHGDTLHLMDIIPLHQDGIPVQEEFNLKRIVKAFTPLLHRKELAVSGDDHVYIKLSLFGKARVAFGSMHDEHMSHEYLIPLYALD